MYRGKDTENICKYYAISWETCKHRFVLTLEADSEDAEGQLYWISTADLLLGCV